MGEVAYKTESNGGKCLLFFSFLALAADDALYTGNVEGAWFSTTAQTYREQETLLRYLNHLKPEELQSKKDILYER